jgi:hypothetical protein
VSEDPLKFDQALVPKTAAEYAFILFIHAILDSHESQHELVESLAAEAKRLDNREVSNRANLRLRDVIVPVDTQNEVEGVFSTIIEEAEIVAEASLDTDPFDVEAFLRDPLGQLYPRMEFEKQLKGIVDRLSGIVELEGATDYIKAYSMASTAGSRGPLFMSAALTVIVSATESRLRRIFARFLEASGAVGSRDDQEARIAKLFGGGLQHWSTRINSQFGLDMETWTDDWSAVTEIFARRHAHVHQGGFVDRSYRDKTGSKEPIGMPLSVTTEYLSEAIDLLSGFCLGALARTWLEVKPELGEAVSGVFSDYVHDLLVSGCNRFVERITSLIPEYNSNELELARSKVNRLLALESRLGSDAIREEAAAWLTDELPEPYRLARLILLKRDDEAMHKYVSIRASGEISPDEVRTWVLFRRWRDAGILQDVDLA